VEERENVLDVLHSERFIDKAPYEVYATLLDEGIYHCSISTMYRILKQNKEVRERRNQLAHPPYHKPELLAVEPNQLWSWDITRLLGPVKWSYFYLYVILDIFSRYVTGWMVATRESAILAKRLIKETSNKQDIKPGQLTIHADRGSSMTSKTVALLLGDLGITKTHSRPHTSNDNPYSEAHFKTLKYRPQFPHRFGCIEDARSFCRTFFSWYNKEHRHTGISLLTPQMVHYGEAKEVLKLRKKVLHAAYEAHPERFVHKEPLPQPLPKAAWINPPKESTTIENYSKFSRWVSQSH
jgi:putative transposase